MSRLFSLITVPLFFMTVSSVAADETQQPQPWQWMLGQHTNYQDTLRNPEATSTPLLYRVQRLDETEAEGMVLLSEQAYLFNSEQPLRRRIYQFIQRRQGWIQHVFEVPADLPIAQLHDPRHWHPIHGCSIRWQQESDHFVGANNPQQCYFFVQETGERVAVSSEIRLYPDYFVLNDDFEFNTDTGESVRTESVHTEYQRTTFYDVSIEYSALSNTEWERAGTTADLHDQGTRVGLVLEESGLELRYQVELQRTLSQIAFKLHDLSRGEIVYEASYADDVDVIEYNSPGLRIRLKPRP